MGLGARLPCDVIHSVCSVRTSGIYGVVTAWLGWSWGLGEEPAALFLSALTILPPGLLH